MLDRLNQKLERVKIRQKGSRLYLRATLPPKTGEGKSKQTDIATGCPATDDGCRAAFGKAQKLESDLIFERFQWRDWIGETTANQTAIAVQKPIETWIEEFETEHWQITQKTINRESCFKRDCLDYLNKLPLDEPLTVETIKKILVKWEPQSRGRRFAYTAFTRLAKYARIDLPTDWSKYRGTYQPSNDRHIPSDEEILQTWERLTGPWKWAYAVLSCYGIRPHELFHLNFDSYPAVEIGKQTKTGQRIVYPLHPQWVDQLEIQKINYPNINRAVNREKGHAVGKTLREKKVSHCPLSLRDAYAIRAAILGISPAIAAKWMGHSIQTHYKHYLRWLDKEDFDRTWQGLR